MTAAGGPAAGSPGREAPVEGADPQRLELREAIRQRGLALGLARVGFARASRLPHGDVLERWAAEGCAGSMRFLHADDDRADPRALLPEARSLIVVAARYSAGGPDTPPPGHGIIARYARGPDYHRVLRDRLERLREEIAALAGREAVASYRVAVDTAPLLEREAAAAAGVGFIGKSTMLIVPGIGSYTALGALLLPLPLPPDTPLSSRCGRCELCLRACPTGALAAPYRVDARRCIAYLTIEHRGDVAPALRPLVGSAVFGCDACQQACPYNAPTPRSVAAGCDPELAPSRPQAAISLTELLALRAGGYRRLVRGRALSRAPASALRRNAAIAAGNDPYPTLELISALTAAAGDPDPAIREAARWALGRLKKPTY